MTKENKRSDENFGKNLRWDNDKRKKRLYYYWKEAQKKGELDETVEGIPMTIRADQNGLDKTEKYDDNVKYHNVLLGAVLK